MERLRKILLRLGRDDESRCLARYYLKLPEHHGRNHCLTPKAANDMNYHFYFLIRMDEDEWDSKRAYMRSALMLGVSHCDTIAHQRSYATLLRALGRKGAAEELARDSLRIVKETCGENSKEVHQVNEVLDWLSKPYGELPELDAYYKGFFGNRPRISDKERQDAEDVGSGAAEKGKGREGRMQIKTKSKTSIKAIVEAEAKARVSSCESGEESSDTPRRGD
ncbi:hypothetical protein DSL72_007882 [Monilinia vaccinii-corymbosi]|uniref:Uncharacterized protein n=1 Tax=Monilinia vaccinii-corymbosi TaxID=61207 RepID=A0A8A3PIW3_9HELO|nr:hypothetical protein DSL72_007882 [Monilinia vaccinii-corymbosi]